VLARYDVIQKGPTVITVSEETTNVNMMQCLNEEVQISVRVHVKEDVKSGLRTTQLPPIRSAVELFLILHQAPKKHNIIESRRRWMV